MYIGHKKHGFTLVELIIALSILSFVIVLCASGFKFSTRVWDRVNDHSAHIDTLQAVQGFLRSSLSHSLVRDRLQINQIEEQQDVVLENLFIGSAQQISYISKSPQYGVDDYLYRYELSMDSELNALVITYSPYNLKLSSSENKKTLSMIEGVKDLEISYFSGFYDEETKASWLPAWNDFYALPLMVKVKLSFIDNSKHWPELVIPMRHGPYVIR